MRSFLRDNNHHYQYVNMIRVSLIVQLEVITNDLQTITLMHTLICFITNTRIINCPRANVYSESTRQVGRWYFKMCHQIVSVSKKSDELLDFILYLFKLKWQTCSLLFFFFLFLLLHDEGPPLSCLVVYSTVIKEWWW